MILILLLKAGSFFGMRAYEKVNGETIYAHGNIFLH